jgi:iron complex outermembrane receptor protein
MSPFRVVAEPGVDGIRIQSSKSVLNDFLLEQHGVAQMQDVTGIAPNLYTSNSDSRGFGDVLALRGSANSIFFSAPAVALFIDDVPSGSVSSYPSTLLNIESFTVKAGPQSTDYGRNAPAGAIDIRTRTPGARHRGKLLAEYGSYDLIAFQAALDGPLGSKAGYSASFGFNDREGYIDNSFLNRTADDRHSVAARGAVYLNPDDTLQLRFGVHFEDVEDDATRLSSLLSPDPYVVSSDLNGETKLDRNQLSFQARKRFDWGSLIATTSRQDWELDPATTDLDLSSLPLAFSNVKQGETTWTQEFRLESAPSTDRSAWRAGVFYFDSEIDGDALRQFMVPPSDFVPPGFIQTEQTIFTIAQRNLAAYANIDRPLTENSILQFGLRVEHSESDLDREKSSSNNFGFPVPADPTLNLSEDDEYVSATAGIVHALSRSVSVQARTSLAHKPAGHTAFTGNAQLARFGSEEAWANEIGLTFSPPNSRFGGSLTGFWNKVEDYQFERTVPNSTDYVVVNAAEVIARGFEAKFMWQAAERVWWDFQAGYTEATFEQHRDSTGANVSGNRVPFVPEFTLRTGVTVDLGGGFSGNVSYAAVGKTYFDERNTGTFAQKSYGIVNAHLRYQFGRWATTVYAQNLTEEDYYQFINPEIYAGSPGAPRRFGVQLSLEY